MKFVKYLFFLMLIASSFYCSAMQQLRKELTNFTLSLQTLADQLQNQQQTPPAILTPSKPALRFKKVKYYKFVYNSQGDTIDFALGLTEVPVTIEGENRVGYNLYLYGPQIKAPSTRTFNDIIKSINQTTGNAAVYPMVNLNKEPYLLLNGNQIIDQELKTQRFENSFLPEWQKLKNDIAAAQATQYNTTNNQIISTSEHYDRDSVDTLKELSEKINALIKDTVSKINNVSLLEEIKQTIETLLTVIINTQKIMNDFYNKLQPESTKSLNLSRNQQQAKFGEELSPISKKGPKLELYKTLLDTLGKEAKKSNEDINILNNALLNQKSIQFTPIKQYYNKELEELKSGKSRSTITHEEEESRAEKRKSKAFDLAQRLAELNRQIEEEGTEEEWEENGNGE